MSKHTIIVSPTDLLGKIAQELEKSLAPDHHELFRLAGLSDFLAVATVANRERVAGRICTSGDKAERVLELIASCGIYCKRSSLDLYPQPDLIEGKVKHHATYVARDTHEGAWAVLYFALDPEFASGAEAAEFNRRQDLAGRLFGYPECCSKFFLQNDGRQEDRTPSTIRDTGPFPSILNPLFAELYGFSLHFHFACSPSCVPSLQIARKRLKFLCSLALSASALEHLGAGISIYGPQIGALLATRYSKLDENDYVIDELITGSAAGISLLENLPQPAKLQLRSAHNFQIGGHSFQDDLHFAAVFR